MGNSRVRRNFQSVIFLVLVFIILNVFVAPLFFAAWVFAVHFGVTPIGGFIVVLSGYIWLWLQISKDIFR